MIALKHARAFLLQLSVGGERVPAEEAVAMLEPQIHQHFLQSRGKLRFVFFLFFFVRCGRSRDAGCLSLAFLPAEGNWPNQHTTCRHTL